MLISRGEPLVKILKFQQLEILSEARSTFCNFQFHDRLRSCTLNFVQIHYSLLNSCIFVKNINVFYSQHRLSSSNFILYTGVNVLKSCK